MVRESRLVRRILLGVRTARQAHREHEHAELARHCHVAAHHERELGVRQGRAPCRRKS